MKLKNSEDANQLQNAIDRLSHIPEIKTRLTVFLYQESNCEEMEGLQNQIKALLRTKASHNQAGQASQAGHARQAGHACQAGVGLQAGHTQAQAGQVQAGHHAQAGHASQAGHARQAGDSLRAGQTQAGCTQARAGQVRAGQVQAGHASQAGHTRQAGQTQAGYTQAQAGQVQAGHTQVQAGQRALENVHLTVLQELNRRQTEKNMFLEMILKRKENSETNNDDQETDSEISESNSDIEPAAHFRGQNPDFNSVLSDLDLIQEFGEDFETNNDDEFPYQQSQLFEVDRQNPDYRALNSDLRDEFPDLIQESDDNSETNDDCLTFGLGSYAEDDINDDEFLYHQSQMFEIERRKT